MTEKTTVDFEAALKAEFKRTQPCDCKLCKKYTLRLARWASKWKDAENVKVLASIFAEARTYENGRSQTLAAVEKLIDDEISKWEVNADIMDDEGDKNSNASCMAIVNSLKDFQRKLKDLEAGASAAQKKVE